MRYLLTILCFIALQASGQALFHAHNKVSAPPASDYCSGVSDANACAFLTATKITDATLKSDIVWLVDTLKSTGLWSEQVAIYPFASDGVERTRKEQHRYNLKDTALYKLTFGVNETEHTATGWDPMLWYAETGLAPNVLEQDDAHMSYYSRSNVGANVDMGSSGGGTDFQVSINYPDLGNISRLNSGFASLTTPANTAGYYLISRTSSTQYVDYWNGSVLNTVSAASGTPNSYPILLGARNTSGAFDNNNSNRECAFSTIGYGLTGAQSVTQSVIVNRFQTKRSRNVY